MEDMYLYDSYKNITTFSNSFRTEQNRETPWTTLEGIYGNKKTVPCVVSIAHTLLFTIIIDIVSRRM